MTLFLILISIAFTVSRFWAPGHPVSLWGTWEVAAHFYAFIVLWEAGKATRRWWKRKPVGDVDAMLIEGNERLRSAYQIAARDGRDTNWAAFRGQLEGTLDRQHRAMYPRPGHRGRFPWLLHALWFVPSMVELALFLAGPFNPKHEAPPQPEATAIVAPEAGPTELEKTLAKVEKWLADHPCPRCGKASCACSTCQCAKAAPVVAPASTIYVDCGCCGNRPCRCAACQCVIRSRP